MYMATITELKADAQQVALENFAKFYVKHFETDGLDVMSQLDQTGHIADINQFLLDNRSLTRADIYNGLLTSRRGNLIALLSALGTSFNDNGIPDTPWEDWFKATVTELPQGL